MTLIGTGGETLCAIKYEVEEKVELDRKTFRHCKRTEEEDYEEEMKRRVDRKGHKIRNPK